eukprot:11688550-Alexandrium_andersonii.AAC.1
MCIRDRVAALRSPEPGHAGRSWHAPRLGAGGRTETQLGGPAAQPGREPAPSIIKRSWAGQ